MKTTFVSIFAFVLSVLGARGADIYVNATAAEGGEGSFEAPFQTIRAGVDAAADGDTVKVYAAPGVTNVWSSQDDILVIPQSNLTIEPYGDSSVAEIRAKSSIGPGDVRISLITVQEGADRVTLRGLSITYECNPGPVGSALGRSGRIIDSYAHYTTVKDCEFHPVGTANAGNGYGGSWIVYSEAPDGYASETTATNLRVSGCLFDGVKTQQPIKCSYKQVIEGNTFLNCDRPPFYAVKSHPGDLLCVSNLFVNSHSINTVGPNWSELQKGEIAYNIFITTTGEPFIDKGMHGLTGDQCPIHHNTVIGCSDFIKVTTTSGTVPLWHPQIFDNLIVLADGGIVIEETATAFNGDNTSSFQTGKGAFFRNNAYFAASLSGGALTLVPGFDLSNGLAVSDNTVLPTGPTFYSTDLSNPDAYRLVDTAYPWVERGWTSEGAYPSYIGARPPLNGAGIDETILGDPSLVRNPDGSYTLSGVLAAGRGVSLAAEFTGGAEFPLTDVPVDAVHSYSRTFVPGVDIDEDAMYGIVVNASGTTGTDNAECPGVFYTGEIVVSAVTNAKEANLQPGSFTISRADTTAAKRLPLTVSFTLSGTAVETVDFERMARSVTIPAGESSVMVFVTPIFNADCLEDTELTLTLDEGPYTLTEAWRSKTMTIKNYAAATGDIYVDALLGDPDNGGTMDAPLQTVAQGVAVAKTAGDVVHVKGGTDRVYDITNENEFVVFAGSRVTLCPWDDEPVVINVSSNLGNTVHDPLVVQIPAGCDDVVIRGLSFVWHAALSRSYPGNSLGYKGSLIRVNGHRCLIEGCSFRQAGGGYADYNCRNVISTGADQNHLMIGTNLCIRGCVFRDAMTYDYLSGSPHVNTSMVVVEGSYNQTIEGCFFTNCVAALSALKGNSGFTTFSSNVLVNCCSFKSNGTGNYGEFSTGEISFNTFVTESGNPFLVKGTYGFSGSPIRIHHNTVVGGPLVEVKANDGAAIPLWYPAMFDNLVIAGAAAAIVETGTALSGTSSSSFTTGKGATFRNNAYLADSLNGGTLTELEGYDLSAGLTIQDNFELTEKPPFVSLDMFSSDFCRPRLRNRDDGPLLRGGWTDGNTLPAYIGALEPVLSGGTIIFLR